MINAPYNFVPLNEDVFYPDKWSEENHKISQDIPFSDHASGSVKFKIKSFSPLFIRNHEVDESDNMYFYERNNKKISTEFCYHLEKGIKTYYIPSTSIKGMTRSVLEIMSFSRILTQDKKFSYRDIKNNNYKNRLMNRQKDIQCGWLYSENNNWKIIELGGAKQFKIEHDELSKVLQDNAVLDFKGKRFTPEQKYNKYNNKFENLITTSGNVAVFTGTVNLEEDKEYMFPLPEKSANALVVDKMAKQTFIDAYYIGQPEVSKVWKSMWENEFNQGGFVPVFYLKDNAGIEHFGLSLLYKLPYENSVYQGIGKHDKNNEMLDMAESIFGFSRNNNDDNEKNAVSLKGRVSFSHSRATGNPKPMGKVTKILSSPKAGYYPTYLEQTNKYKLETMDTEKFKVSGWKRYPVHQSSNQTIVKDGNTTTSFNPLPADIEFEGVMRFHNLRKFELGALLSALSMHGNNEDYFHSIGMAKPYGYGKIKIEINMDNTLYVDAVKEFESKMENWCKEENLGSWLQSEQIVELFSMMKEANDTRLDYIGFKEYGNKKNNNVARERYSKMSKSSVVLDSFCDGSIEKKIEKAAAEKKRKRKKEKELEERVHSTPERNSNEFKDIIKKYVMKTVSPKYYQYGDLKKVLEYKEEDIISTDIYNAYMELADSKSFKVIESLLIKREKNQATDLELAELYEKLTNFTK